MDIVSLGDRIRRAREAKGWSVERGERSRIPPDRLAAYARALGVELSELVGEEQGAMSSTTSGA